MTYRAIVLLATGSPASQDDVEAFLLDIREGRPSAPELVEKIRQRYRQIGGSPFLRITLAQAVSLKDALARRGVRVPVVPGMCHSEPRIHGAVEQLKREGIEHAVAIVMTPFASSFNRSRYTRRLDAAQAELGTRIDLRWAESWWREPKFVEAWAGIIRQALSRDSSKTKLLFTTHSLPARVLSEGDPYAGQFAECAELIVGRLGGADWTTAFQSAGAGPERWLGPSVNDILPALAKTGYRRVVVAPIGFACDNVETLYDLDIEAKELANGHHLRLDRAGPPNTEPVFIEAMADAVGKALS